MIARVLRESFMAKRDIHKLFLGGDVFVTTRLHPSPHQRNHSSKSKPGGRCFSCVFMYAFAELETRNIKRLFNLFCITEWQACGD